MGQRASQPSAQEASTEVLGLCELVSGAVVHAAQRLKDHLGFDDPLSQLRPTANTLTEIFLIHFVTFCREKGAGEWLTTTKMTKHQALLFGADWIWTFWGPNKQIQLQLAVQTLRMTPLPPRDPRTREWRAEEPPWRKSRLDRLEEFCTLVGEDCLGLVVVFGVPGKPGDIRAVVLDSVRRRMSKTQESGCRAVEQLVLETEECVSIKDLLGCCLKKKDGLRKMGQGYISIP